MEPLEYQLRGGGPMEPLEYQLRGGGPMEPLEYQGYVKEKALGEGVGDQLNTLTRYKKNASFQKIGTVPGCPSMEWYLWSLEMRA